jgi:hypothetical protein
MPGNRGHLARRLVHVDAGPQHPRHVRGRGPLPRVAVGGLQLRDRVSTVLLYPDGRGIAGDLPEHHPTPQHERRSRRGSHRASVVPSRTVPTGDARAAAYRVANRLDAGNEQRKRYERWQCGRTGRTIEPTSVIVLAYRVFRMVKLAHAA